LQQFIETYVGKDSAGIFYFVGKKQAYAASQIQIQQYGRKNDKKLYLSMIQQHELVGMGLGEVILFDAKKMRVEIKSDNNTYLRYAEK